MAEGETSEVPDAVNEPTKDEGISDWFGGWLKSAKSKSLEVMDFMQKDIDEFTSTIRQEAGNVVSTTATSLRDKLKLEDPSSTAGTMKKSMSDFFGHVAQVFTPDTEDDGDTEAYVLRNNEPILMDRLQTQMLALRQTHRTFTEDPEPQTEYQMWLSDFDMEKVEPSLSDLMVTHSDLRTNYTKLVPSQVSHLEFWRRYFFRIRQLEAEEKQREALKQRAEQTKTTEAEILDWGEDDFANNDVDIPKDVQDKLLKDYEKEIDEKKKPSPVDECKKDTSSEQVIVSETGDTKELRTHERGDMVVIDGSSSRTTPSSGEKESLDDDWEKELEIESNIEESSSQQQVDKSEKEDDWDSWE